MKRTKIREWTCDRCGKTATTTSVFGRPLSIDKTKIRIGAGLYLYHDEWDLCTACANTLTDMLEEYMKKGKGETDDANNE